MAKSRTTKPIQWKEAKKCLAYLESEKQYHFLLTLAIGFYTGYRVSDLLELKYSDFQKDLLHIRERKTTKQRDLPVFPEIRRIVEWCRTEQLKQEDDFIFTRARYRSRQPITKAAFINRVKAAFEFCGLKFKNISAHTLRKTFALHYYSLMEKRVGSHRALIETAKILNHSNVEVTRRYIGIDEVTKEEVLAAWDLEF